jgi:hypothetical protein
LKEGPEPPDLSPGPITILRLVQLAYRLTQRPAVPRLAVIKELLRQMRPSAIKPVQRSLRRFQ